MLQASKSILQNIGKFEVRVKFGGLQKLTLLDYPGKVACTVFAVGCNFRCPFCHNATLVGGSGDEWTESEILTFLAKRQNVLEGVCLTGGEPLLQADVTNFLRKVKDLGYNVKLDTNGSAPDRLASLIQCGLVDYVAMDVKNSRELYCATAGANVDLSAVEKSVDILLAGATEFEFRTTVTRTFHSEQSIVDLAKWLGNAPKWYLQQFVHGDDLIDSAVCGYSDDELRKLAQLAKAYCPNVQTRGI